MDTDRPKKFFCNKCGYFGIDQTHRRPKQDGTGSECPYTAIEILETPRTDTRATGELGQTP